MRAPCLLFATVAALAITPVLPVPAASDRGPKDRLDEAALRAECARLFEELDSMRIAAEYRRAVKNVLSVDPPTRIEGLTVLGATSDPAVIPWIVTGLSAPDPRVRAWAASALSRVVSRWALRRRDPKVGHAVVLLPLSPGETDLRPLAWVVLQMLRRPDDGNTHAAAEMIRYLELRDFAPHLRALLDSRHPAVSNKAAWALQSLDLPIEPRSGERE